MEPESALQQASEPFHVANIAQIAAHSAVMCGFAENPGLPPDLADMLIRHGDEQILSALAARADLTDQQVESVAASGSLLAVTTLVNAGRLPLPAELLDDADSLGMLAEWNQIPEARLPRLALHRDPRIRKAVAFESDRLPLEAVRALAGDDDVEVVCGVARCADLPADLARALAAHPDCSVHAALAANPATAPDVLVQLVADARCGEQISGIADVQDAALRNERTPISALMLHVGHRDPILRAVIAERADLPAEYLTILAVDIEDVVRAGVAVNPSCPERLLRMLAQDESTAVRRRVALNPRVPLDLLYDLAAHTRLNLRAGIPAMENASSDQIRGLARSRVAQVRALAASRADLPGDLIRSLADDSDAGVAKQVAAHSSLDADDVRLLVARHGPRIYSAAARNPNCPSELLHTMARNSATVPRALSDIACHPATEPRTLVLCLAEARARPFVAAHPRLLTDTLIALLDDAEWQVANQAAANPALPAEAMRSRISSALAR